MDEKQSQDGSLPGGSLSHDANTPVTAPPPVTTVALPSSPAGFNLASLITTLPEPPPRPVSPVVEPAPLQPPPPTPPALAAAPAIPAPAFTPFAPRTGPAAPVPAPSAYARAKSVAATTVRYTVIAFTAWFVTVMLLIALFRFVNPPQSMLMLTKRLGGETLQHEWTPLTQISTNLRRAVVTSEDAKFCRHWGFDVGEIRAAMNRTDGYGRGASTITQQLAKNLFLWPGKSYIRKALEVPLTLAIEALWPKKRILEVYLNIAEWGPGVFGAEAAAQYYYNKPASGLTEREAALLAVSLPNPIARDASDPNAGLARRASTLQARMRVQGISYCALTPKPN